MSPSVEDGSPLSDVVVILRVHPLYDDYVSVNKNLPVMSYCECAGISIQSCEEKLTRFLFLLTTS